MTLAGWKRSAGPDPATSAVEREPVTPSLQAELEATRHESADPRSLLHSIDAFSETEIDTVVAPPTHSPSELTAVSDLQRALAELERPPAVEPSPPLPAFGSPEALQMTVPFGVTGSVPTVAPPQVASANPAQAVPAPVSVPAQEPQLDQQFGAQQFGAQQFEVPQFGVQQFGVQQFGVQQFGAQPGTVHQFTPPGHTPPVAPPGGAAMQFSPAGVAVPPVYTKDGSSAAKTVGVVVAIIIGVILVVCVAIVGAVSMLGAKVQQSFNAIQISNTLPGDSGFTVIEPAAQLPLDDPSQLQGSPEFAAYLANSGVQSSAVWATNTLGPVAFAVDSSACAVFLPNTMIYGAVDCGGPANAQRVVAGTSADVAAACVARAATLTGVAVPVEQLWILTYDTGVAECFVRTPDWTVSDNVATRFTS